MIAFFISWLGVMVPLVLSPGPANIVFAASGAKFGVKRSLRLLAGIDLVFLIKSLLIGFGLGALIEAMPILLDTIQVVGAVYLLYLAYKFARAETAMKQQETNALSFSEGALIQLLNAKGWVLVVLMFSLFTSSAENHFGEWGLAVLCLLLLILNVTCHLIWIAFGTALQRLLDMGSNEKLQNRFFAFTLLCVAIALLMGVIADAETTQQLSVCV